MIQKQTGCDRQDEGRMAKKVGDRLGAGEADLEDPGPGSWSHPSPRHLWSIRRKRGNFLVQEESKIGVRP